jgi:hypothetical protein
VVPHEIHQAEVKVSSPELLKANLPGDGWGQLLGASVASSLS